MTTRSLIRTLTIAAVLAVSTAASAGPSAQGFVQSKHSELTSLVQEKGKTSNEKVKALFDEIIDYETLARESLSEHWEARSAAERTEFTDVLRQLVRRAYRKNLDKTVGYEVTYDGQTAVGKAQLVKTVARSKTNARAEPVSIDYLVLPTGSTWRITDIITEGSSLVKNYRRQFDRVIDKKGFPELLRRMKTKLDKG